jgi:hypothetical protein
MKYGSGGNSNIKGKQQQRLECNFFLEGLPAEELLKWGRLTHLQVDSDIPPRPRSSFSAMA